MLLIKPLSQYFFDNNPNLVQILDTEKSDQKKLRGYAVITIQIEDNIFAVPLHSNCRSKCFSIEETHVLNENGTYTVTKKGLDYQKAVIIKDPNKELMNRSFKIDQDDFIHIQNNEEKIINEFTKYVEKYKKDFEILKPSVFNKRYGHSTLQNYHKELKISK